MVSDSSSKKAPDDTTIGVSIPSLRYCDPESFAILLLDILTGIKGLQPVKAEDKSNSDPAHVLNAVEIHDASLLL